MHQAVFSNFQHLYPINSLLYETLKISTVQMRKPSLREAQSPPQKLVTAKQSLMANPA